MLIWEWDCPPVKLMFEAASSGHCFPTLAALPLLYLFLGYIFILTPCFPVGRDVVWFLKF